MQNVFQIGVPLTQLVSEAAPGAESAPKIGPAEAAMPVQHDAKFQTVFDTVQAALAKSDEAASPHDMADMTLAEDGPVPLPQNLISDVEALFVAIEQGEIAMDDLFEPGSAMHQQMSAALKARSDNPQADEAHVLSTKGDTGLWGSGVRAPETDGNAAQPLTAAHTTAPSTQPGAPVSPMEIPMPRAGSAPIEPHPILPDQSARRHPNGLPPVAPLGDGPKTPMAASTDLPNPLPPAGEGELATRVGPERLTSQTTAPTDQPTLYPPSKLNTSGDERALAIAREMETGGRGTDQDSLDGRWNSHDKRGIDLAPLPPVIKAGAPPLGSALPPAGQPAPGEHTGLSLSGLDADLLNATADISAKEARLPGVAGPALQPATFQMLPPHAQQVARQIAFAIQSNGGQSVEITLNPAELGRVRINLSNADAGMVISIQAERPETLELMRRNVDLLAQDFLEIGYDGATFSFEGSEQRPETAANMGEGEGDNPLGPSSDIEVIDTPDQPPVRILTTGDRAIDIRL